MSGDSASVYSTEEKGTSPDNTLTPPSQICTGSCEESRSLGNTVPPEDSKEAENSFSMRIGKHPEELDFQTRESLMIQREGFKRDGIITGKENVERSFLQELPDEGVNNCLEELVVESHTNTDKFMILDDFKLLASVEVKGHASFGKITKIQHQVTDQNRINQNAKKGFSGCRNGIDCNRILANSKENYPEFKNDSFGIIHLQHLARQNSNLILTGSKYSDLDLEIGSREEDVYFSDVIKDPDKVFSHVVKYFDYELKPD